MPVSTDLVAVHFPTRARLGGRPRRGDPGTARMAGATGRASSTAGRLQALMAAAYAKSARSSEVDAALSGGARRMLAEGPDPPSPRRVVQRRARRLRVWRAFNLDLFATRRRRRAPAAGIALGRQPEEPPPLRRSRDRRRRVHRRRKAGLVLRLDHSTQRVSARCRRRAAGTLFGLARDTRPLARLRPARQTRGVRADAGKTRQAISTPGCFDRHQSGASAARRRPHRDGQPRRPGAGEPRQRCQLRAHSWRAPRCRSSASASRVPASPALAIGSARRAHAGRRMNLARRCSSTRCRSWATAATSDPRSAAGSSDFRRVQPPPLVVVLLCAAMSLWLGFEATKLQVNASFEKMIPQSRIHTSATASTTGS